MYRYGESLLKYTQSTVGLTSQRIKAWSVEVVGWRAYGALSQVTRWIGSLIENFIILHTRKTSFGSVFVA